MTDSQLMSPPSMPSLSEIETYLLRSGWTLTTSDRTDVWVPGDHSHAGLQVALPRRETVLDLRVQIDEAVKVVAYVEGRTVAETTSSIVNGGADTVSLRLLPNLPSGVATLSTLEESISALRALVVGSAAALNNSDLVLPSRRSALVENYAANAHVSSRPGSFILDLALPLAAEADPRSDTPIQDSLVDVKPRPFGRSVTERIRRVTTNALAMAERVQSGDASIEVFGRPELRLGNALELDALARMGGDLDTPYQLRLSQSALAQRTAASTVLRASSAQRARLAEASEFLRSTQPQTGVSVEGFVVRLFRDGGSGPGDVTVRSILDDSGKLKSCVMNLGDEDYTEALRAHDKGLVVAARGDLVTAGTRKRLTKVSGFHVTEQLA